MIIMILLSTVLASQAGQHWVCEANKNLLCLMDNSNEAYQQDHKKFAEVFNKESEDAISCKSLQKTASLLNFSIHVPMPTEIHEGVLQDIETKLIIVNPKCFLDAVIRLPKEKIKVIADNLIRPTFLEDVEISKALKKHEKNKKYSKFFNFYIKAK